MRRSEDVAVEQLSEPAFKQLVEAISVAPPAPAAAGPAPLEMPLAAAALSPAASAAAAALPPAAPAAVKLAKQGEHVAAPDGVRL